MTTAMKQLANGAQENSEAFQKLGISEKELKSLSQEELFAKTVEELQKMEAGTEKTALASKLLGRSAMDMGALLNMSAEETAEMNKELEALGGIMSDDAVKAGATFEDSLLNLKTAFASIKRTMSADFCRVL